MLCNSCMDEIDWKMGYWTCHKKEILQDPNTVEGQMKILNGSVSDAESSDGTQCEFDICKKCAITAD